MRFASVDYKKKPSSFSLDGLRIGFLAGSLNRGYSAAYWFTQKTSRIQPVFIASEFWKKRKRKKIKSFFLCSSDHRRPHGVVLPVVVTCRRWNVWPGGCDCQLLLPPGGQQTAVRGEKHQGLLGLVGNEAERGSRMFLSSVLFLHHFPFHCLDCDLFFCFFFRTIQLRWCYVFFFSNNCVCILANESFYTVKWGKLNLFF